MSNYCYEAVDAGGSKTQGMLDVSDQSEALRRIKEMGLFPVKIVLARQRLRARMEARERSGPTRRISLGSIQLFNARPRQRVLTVFTRQLATLLEAGMPLLRGLRTLQEQHEDPALTRILLKVALEIEGGGTLSDAFASHPKVFNALYVNMVKAGEIGGALEITLRRLAEFMEKSQRIKGKIKAAMFYPAAVIFISIVILVALMTFVVPRFQQVFAGLLGGQPMPRFTVFILNLSELVKNHIVSVGLIGCGMFVAFLALIRTRRGRCIFDWFKLVAPVFGPVFRKLAISRFARTLGTLLNSGVPILQALSIVRETAGNVRVGDVIASIRESVKLGETIAVPMKASRIFPAMVAGMVDVGEQTGALPDMLLKIADGYEAEVDDAVSAMTSLLEPIMIVFLAIVVGSIVIALFLPIIGAIGGLSGDESGGN